MTYVIAQLSDIHIGGPTEGNGERFSAAIDVINAMTRQPDLVLLTGDNTHNGTTTEWAELKERLEPLNAHVECINGNHDQDIAETSGHRSIQVGPLNVVLLDTSEGIFTEDDEEWLRGDLAGSSKPTIVAMHHPPFETGIWWMDCVGLERSEAFERIVRDHPHVIKIVSGHVHRAIQASWDGCSLWVSPSTSGAIAIDLDPDHEPAVTSEPPAFSLHAFTGQSFVSHVVPVGPSADRLLVGRNAPEFVEWARSVQTERSDRQNWRGE